MGALPTLRAATDPNARGGTCYGPGGLGELRGPPVRVEASAYRHRPDVAARLWEVSARLTGLVELASFGLDRGGTRKRGAAAGAGLSYSAGRRGRLTGAHDATRPPSAPALSPELQCRRMDLEAALHLRPRHEHPHRPLEDLARLVAGGSARHLRERLRAARA